MIPSGFDKTPVGKFWSALLDSLRAQLVILAASVALYILAFLALPDSYSPIIAPLIMIPVMLAGLFFGIKFGTITAVIAILLNAALYTIKLQDGWQVWNGTAWPMNITILLAGYISGAIRAGAERQNQINQQLQTRERYISLINMSTQDILTYDTDDRYYYLISHLVNLLIADYGHIVIWDEAHDKIDQVVTTRPQNSTSLDPQEFELVSSALSSGKNMVFGNASTPDQAAGPGPSDDKTQPAKSGICIPLISKGHKLGAVLLAFLAPHRFSDDEIHYSELAGRRIALTLWNAFQDAELQHRLHEADTLAAIGRALSETERVGLDHVLQLIVDSAQELIPAAEQAVIHLLDEEQQVLISRAVAGFNQPGESKAHMRLGEGVAGRVIADGVSINIADVASDPQFVRHGAPPRFRSLMVSPLQSGEKRLGTISVQSNKTNAFTPEEMQLLDSLGIQASIAIENAHLLEITQQGLKEVNALYRITQGLVASLDTDQLMKDAVELLQQSFGYYHVQIYVSDGETGELIMQQGSGEIGAVLKSNGHRMKAGSGIIGHAAETGAPFITNNVQNVVFYVSTPLLPDTQSELAVPIIVNKHVLGVLDVQNAAPNRLTDRDLQLVSTVADQLAVALQKASLYSDLQVSLTQETSMRSQLIQSERLALVGRLLASVSHELNNPLQAIQNALFLLHEEKGISAQGRQDLQIVLSETERMAGLIDRLRTSYRSTRTEDLQPVQVNTVIEDVHALMSTHLRHNNIAFEFHPDPNLPLIAGLPDQIRQVILNLLMNGVDAMPSGGRLNVSTQMADKRQVLLTVSDTGSGISEDILPHIFDAFVTNKESGTGLGLTITYDIIHRHNGHIQAENNPERGATFKIWLQTYAQENLK